MLKKTKRLWLLSTISIAGILIGTPLFFYDALNGNPIRSILMENATKKHLMNHGYHADDLLDVKAYYSLKKDNGIKRTRAFVIFKDEPDQKYVYIQQEQNGEIQQSCSYFNLETDAYESHYTDKRKHMVQDCTSTIFSFKQT